MSPILFFIIFFTCTGVGKMFLQINSAAVAFIDIVIAAWEGLKLAINGQSDKGFLLTSTFVPKGLSAPTLSYIHV